MQRSGVMQRLSAIVSLAALVLAVLPSCKRCGFGQGEGPDSERRGPPVPIASRELDLGAPGASEHRLLLDRPALARLREAARAKAPAWEAVSARCDEAMAQPISSGYQAFDWADAVANLSLCWHATGDARYARVAARYLYALLDDQYVVDDGKGGASVIPHDSGYGIRTYAVYVALGYDWLRGSPVMDVRLQKRVVERLEQWLTWYKQSGYLRTHPFANYYWGYLTALSFAGLALSGETPSARAWLSLAKSELETNVLPSFRDKLVGGGWPEGWQYGEYTTLEIALVAEAFRTGAGIDLAAKLPWLGQVVTHHVHALLPDERSVYDGGTWSEHPAQPSALGMSGVAIALEHGDTARAAEARFLAARVLPPLTREHVWVRLLAHRAQPTLRDPRKGAPTSLHLPGQGLSFMRSDWSRSAVWASFQAGPFLAEDHQDKDQGHFELWRGSDGLLVDGGDEEGSATSNHNSLLIDDGGRHLNYSPNQGVWGSRVRTRHFGDDGRVVALVGDLTEAYAPNCIADGCSDRSVEKAVRRFVFVRPSLLVIDDRVVLERPSYGVTWAAHVTTNPVLAGNLASAVVGSSRVDVRMLEPDDAEQAALREPTASGEGPHRQNHPWGPMWRIEFTSQRGSRERGFLSFITVAPASAKPPAARRVQGDHLHGALSTLEGKSLSVLFADADRGRLDFQERVGEVVIAGLEPGRRYRVAFDVSPTCAVSLRLEPGDSGTAATSGGFVRLEVPRCESR